MDENSSKSSSKPQAKPKRSTFGVLSWVLGALSLLNLVNELTPVEIVGKLKVWLKAYTNVIEIIRDLFFGWINFAWLNVNEIEIHIIVIGLVLASAHFRLFIRYGLARHGDLGTAVFGSVVSVGVTCAIVMLGPIILLPGWLGIVGAGAGIGINYYWSLTEQRPESSPGEVKLELVGVTGVFLLLIALNYSVFS